MFVEVLHIHLARFWSNSVSLSWRIRNQNMQQSSTIFSMLYTWK